MLTPREREVAGFVALGLTNREIAARMGIGRRTAESYVESILIKLGFTSRTQIAVWMVQQSADTLPSGDGPRLDHRRGGGTPGPEPASPRRRASRTGMASAEEIRNHLEEHAAHAGTAGDELDAAEAAVHRYGVRYASLGGRLPELTGEIVRIRELLSFRLSEQQRQRAYRLLAQVGVLVGANLALRGCRQEAAGWYDTAYRMGDLAYDPAVQAWVLVMRARGALLRGEVARARSLARRGLAVAGHDPAARLWAWDTQAQTLAGEGRSRDALAVAGKVVSGYERWRPSLADGVFGYPEAQAHRMTGAVHAFAGDVGEAVAAIGAATRMFPEGFMRTLLSLDEVVALIRQGEIEQACAVAGRAWDGVPAEHRSGVLKAKLAWNLRRIPARYRNVGCVVDLQRRTA